MLSGDAEPTGSQEILLAFFIKESLPHIQHDALRVHVYDGGYTMDLHRTERERHYRIYKNPFFFKQNLL